MNCEEVLRRMGTKRRVIFRIKKRQVKFLGHMMRKGGFENMTLTGHRTQKDRRNLPNEFV